MTQPDSIFANCSRHYDFELLYEVCVNATNPCKSISQVDTAITLVYVDYYSSLVLFSIAGLINIYCLIAILPVFRRMHNDSKKKYIFLITRCIAGLLLVVAWLLIQCIYLRYIAPTPDNFPWYVLALSLNIGSTYLLLGSYVGMAGILYLGVLNPVAFHQLLSLRVVYAAVFIVFLVSIIISIPLATFQAAIAIPTSIKCTDQSCAPLITLINFVLVTGSLVISTVALSFVLISLLRHRKEFKKLDTVSNSSLNSGIRLLSWTLFSVSLISCAEIIPFIFMEIRKHQGTITGCYWFYHSSKMISEVTFAMIEVMVWSFALIIDPLTNVIFDRTVSKQASNQIKWMRKSCFRLARNVTGKFSKRKRRPKEEEVEEEVCQRHTTHSDIVNSS